MIFENSNSYGLIIQVTSTIILKYDWFKKLIYFGLLNWLILMIIFLILYSTNIIILNKLGSVSITMHHYLISNLFLIWQGVKWTVLADCTTAYDNYYMVVIHTSILKYSSHIFNEISVWRMRYRLAVDRYWIVLTPALITLKLVDLYVSN